LSIAVTSSLAASVRPAATSKPAGAVSNAQGAGPLESKWNVGRALNTAQSAYRNERFASVLEQLSDPRSSLTVALMRSEQGQTATVGFAQSAYADNS
jgi:hypothetical protein